MSADAVQLGLPDLMIIGPMGAGKTTAAEFLVKEFGYERRPIAGEHLGGIRDVAVRLWGSGARNDREKLNTLALVDDAFPGTWIHNWESAVDAGNGERHWPIVVDDVRRDLEYYALLARGFACIRVVSDESDRRERLQLTGKYQNEEQFTGRWEQWWPTAIADYEIVNDGSMWDLYNDLIDVVKRERKRR